ncbi:unnamed protein product, partial [Rotaria magnacalcarata]
RSNSASSIPTISVRKHSRSTGHRRFDSSGGINELVPLTFISPIERIQHSVAKREQELQQKLRERKQIGQIFNSNNTTTSN